MVTSPPTMRGKLLGWAGALAGLALLAFARRDLADQFAAHAPQVGAFIHAALQGAVSTVKMRANAFAMLLFIAGLCLGAKNDFF